MMKKHIRGLCLTLCVLLLLTMLPAGAEQAAENAAQSGAEVSLQTGQAPEPEETPVPAESAVSTAAELVTAGIEQPSDRLTSTYDYPIWPDQNHITDADFFGEWDQERGRWAKTPYFDYGYAEGLRTVEELVKQTADGDYSEAKLALYDYYVQKERNFDRPQSRIEDKSQQQMADLWLKNFVFDYTSGVNLLNIFEVIDQPGYTAVDVTDWIASSVGITLERGFIITAMDKDDETVVFNSQNSGENRPYLDIRVNGTSQRIYASDDTYVSAGANSNTCYGLEDRLYAEESGIGESQPVNEDTKRIYLKFNTSSLKKGDTVTAAALNLYGNTQNGTPKKELALFDSSDTSWEEETACLANVFGQTMYSYDQETQMPWVQPDTAAFRYEETWFRFAENYKALIRAYNSTMNEQYAYTAIRVLMDYIRCQGANPAHKKTLDAAVRGQELPGDTFELIESVYMTPETFTAILKFMWRLGDVLSTFETFGNWGASETQGLFTVACNYPEFASAPKWVRRVRERYEVLSADSVREDSSCAELSMLYVDYTLNTISASKTIAEQFGVDYPYTQATLKRLQNLGRFLYYTTMPGTYDNQFGDGGPYRTCYDWRLGILGAWFDDEEMLYSASHGTIGRPPEQTSMMFPEGRIAVMRSSWEDDAKYLHINANGAVGNHGHQDDLSIILSANGQYLLADPLYGTYSTEAGEVNWLTSTRAHNSIDVNGKTQSTGASGSMDRWETNSFYDFLQASTPNNADAAHTREVLFVRPDFWIVSDTLAPKNTNSNVYVQSWHMTPTAGITMDSQTRAVTTHFDQANLAVVPMGAEQFSRSEVVEGIYSEGQGSYMKADYVEYEKRQSGSAVFHTLLLPEDVGQNFTVSTEQVQLNVPAEQASAFEIRQTENNSGMIGNYLYYLVHDTAKKTERKVGPYQTNARMMFAELGDNETLKSVILQDVNQLSGHHTLVKSKRQIPELSIEWSRSQVALNASSLKEKDLKDLVISTQGSQISEVTLNQQKVQFYSKDGYLVFDQNTVPDEPAVTPAPTVRPSGGGGGGISHGTQGGQSAVPAPSASAVPPPVETAGPFSDLGEAEWARSYIMTLYEKGIVQGTGDGKFSPGRALTREEMVKLLVLGLEIENAGETAPFADVEADSWYAPYVAAAQAAGIVQGISETAFGVGQPVTREDAACMLARALELARAEPEREKAVFSDQSEIADYAVDSVSYLASLGMINGDENGRFRPRQPVTRAEMAKLLCLAMEKSRNAAD